MMRECEGLVFLPDHFRGRERIQNRRISDGVTSVCSVCSVYRVCCHGSRAVCVLHHVVCDLTSLSPEVDSSSVEIVEIEL